MINTNKNIKLALVVVILSAILGGGLNPFIKLGLKSIPPMSFMFVRFLVASLVLVPFFIKNKLSFKDVIKIAPFSIIGTINIIFFVLGLRYTTAISSQLFYLSVPITVLLLSHYFYKEKISLIKLSGIAVGLIGAMLLILQKTDSSVSQSDNLFGNLLIVTATIFYSLYMIFSKKVQLKYPPILITTGFSLTSALVTFLFSLTEYVRYGAWWTGIDSMTMVSILYIGLFGTAGYYLLQQYAVKHSSPLISSLTLYIQPVFTIIWSYFLLGEVLTGFLAFASILIFIGAFLVSGSGRRSTSQG